MSTSKLREALETARSRSQELRDEVAKQITAFEASGIAILSAPAAEIVSLATQREAIKATLRDLALAQSLATADEEAALEAYSRARMPEVEREIDTTLQRLRRALREAIRELRPIAAEAAILEAEARTMQYPGLARRDRDDAWTEEAALLSSFGKALAGVEADFTEVQFTRSYAPKFGPLAKKFFSEGSRAVIEPGTAALLVGEGVAEVVHG